MSFVCCGVKYSKNDPETYWCIDTDLTKPIQKKFVGNDRVLKEVVDTLTCKKNGCLKVQIKRFGTLRGRKKVLEVENLSGEDAFLYLHNTAKVRVRQPLACPIQSVPFAKFIPMRYGKFLGPERQRPRYLNEQDWAGDVIKTECKIIQI